MADLPLSTGDPLDTASQARREVVDFWDGDMQADDTLSGVLYAAMQDKVCGLLLMMCCMRYNATGPLEVSLNLLEGVNVLNQ